MSLCCSHLEWIPCSISEPCDTICLNKGCFILRHQWSLLCVWSPVRSSIRKLKNTHNTRWMRCPVPCYTKRAVTFVWCLDIIVKTFCAWHDHIRNLLSDMIIRSSLCPKWHQPHHKYPAQMLHPWETTQVLQETENICNSLLEMTTAPGVMVCQPRLLLLAVLTQLLWTMPWWVHLFPCLKVPQSFPYPHSGLTNSKKKTLIPVPMSVLVPHSVKFPHSYPFCSLLIFIHLGGPNLFTHTPLWSVLLNPQLCFMWGPSVFMANKGSIDPQEKNVGGKTLTKPSKSGQDPIHYPTARNQ